MELINKKDALHAVLHNYGDAAVAAVQNIESVDAVPVVRCGECKYFDGDQCCDKIGILVIDAELFYCADGERKDGERDA